MSSTPALPPHFCAPLPTSTCHTTFHCSFCLRLSHYPSAYWYDLSLPRCLHCPHTHTSTHHVYRVSSSTVLRHDCDRCRIYAFYAFHKCWACGDLSDSLTVMKRSWLLDQGDGGGANCGRYFECGNYLSGDDGDDAAARRCRYPLDSSCGVQWVGGVSRPVWVSARNEGMVRAWRDAFDSARDGGREMDLVEGPGVVLEGVERGERKWDMVDVHVIVGDEVEAGEGGKDGEKDGKAGEDL